MSSFLALNGARVVSGHVSVPYYGTWTADVMLPIGTSLSVGTAVTLTLGNLTLAGSVYRSGAFAGQVRIRAMGGGGGWQKTVSAQQYALGGGVQLSTVLKDLAATVGEKVNVVQDFTLGSTFTREATWAGRILRQIAGPLWYVDTTGVTQVRASRPTSTIATAFEIVRYDGDRGEFEVATEDYASWQPGATFSNEIVPIPQTVSLATIDTDNDGILRFTVLTTAPQTDRLIDDLRSLVREEVETLTFLGVYEYSVQKTNGTTVDAVPTSPSIPIPSLRGVTLRSGIPGTVVKPAIGSKLAVSFLNGDPTKPIVDPIYDSTKAQSVAFQGGNLGVARGGLTAVPPGAPPWIVAIPTGDQVVLAFTALDSSGNAANTGSDPLMTPPPSLWDGMSATQKSYYPATGAGFTEALAASLSLTPPGLGVGAVFGFISGHSGTVTCG